MILIPLSTFEILSHSPEALIIVPSNSFEYLFNASAELCIALIVPTLSKKVPIVNFFFHFNFAKFIIFSARLFHV